jgi:acetyltransferase
LADLSPQTLACLKNVFPEWMPVTNPIDLWPGVILNGAPKAYGNAVRAVCADPDVDAVFVHCFTGGFDLEPDMPSLAETAREAGKPIFCWLSGQRDAVYEFQNHTQQLGLPVFREVRRAVECISAVINRNQNHRPATPKADLISSAIEIPLDVPNLQKLKAGALDERVSKRILTGYGIPVVDERIVTTAAEARNAAADFGLPVVMKGMAADIVHKTEAGLVRLGIYDFQAVETAFSDLEQRMQGMGEILIQKQIQGDFELIAGLVHDAQFGPCVMFGFGGVLANILASVAFRTAPLSHAQALDMISELKAQELFNGHRGSTPLDRDALAGVLMRVGELGTTQPRIREIDINPLIISAGQPVAVDASLILSD